MANTDPDLPKALLTKLGITPQALSQRVAKRKRECDQNATSTTWNGREREEMKGKAPSAGRGKSRSGAVHKGTRVNYGVCRRRDSNPRHADYDSAALTS